MKTSIITRELVQTIIGKRRREIHKGDCGRVLIAAGSAGMAGAAVIAARAALRSGSGLVQVAIPAELFPIIQTGVPEATCLERDFSKLDLGRFDAAAVGPGLGKGEESVSFVKELIRRFDGTLVIDADGLNIVAEQGLFSELRSRRPTATVITPHAGEAARLLAAAGKAEAAGKAASGGEEDRLQTARLLHELTGAVAVLKGHGTLVAVNDEETYINTTGNPGMATAGAGDALTGVIVSLAGQHKAIGGRITAAEAAAAGVFIHGMAGDLAARSTGEYGLLATDIAYFRAMALKELTGC